MIMLKLEESRELEEGVVFVKSRGRDSIRFPRVAEASLLGEKLTGIDR